MPTLLKRPIQAGFYIDLLPSMSSDEDSSAPSEGAIDMDQLRRMIAKAKPGTGAIAASIAQARFSPGQAAFTSLLQVRSNGHTNDTHTAHYIDLLYYYGLKGGISR